MELLTAGAIGSLFAVGVYQLLQRNVIRSVIGLVLLSGAINLFLLAVGVDSAEVPAYSDVTGTRSDALPQALILTAIVISMGGTAFVLALLVIIAARYRTGDMDSVRGLRR